MLAASPARRRLTLLAQGMLLSDNGTLLTSSRHLAAEHGHTAATRSSDADVAAVGACASR